MTRANFTLVAFHEHLGDAEDAGLFQHATFAGEATSVREFEVEGVPVHMGYLVVQLARRERAYFDVLINGQAVERGDSAPEMVVFDGRRLKRGTNTLQLRRVVGSDDFAVHGVAIHWREAELIGDTIRNLIEVFADKARPDEKAEDKPAEPPPKPTPDDPGEN